MNTKLIKCISILLIVIIMIVIFINLFLIKEVKAGEQNTKDYKKGSNILDKYPGYASLLDDLMEEHPNWTFTILFTGLNWNSVIKNETTSKHGRNLVQGKSGEWVCSVCGDKPYDNGSWKCASSATVSYYMDPRNSLFEDYIFQFENLKWVDGKYTISGIEQILDGCDYLLKDKIDKLSNKDIAQNASKLEIAIQKSGEILRNKKGITSKDIKLNELHQKHREIKQEILKKLDNGPRGLVRRDSPYSKELTNLMQKQGIIEAEISLRDMQIESEVVNRVYSKENKQNSFRESLKVNQENGWYIASVEDNNGRENSIKEKDGWHIAPVEGNQTKNENSIDKENGWHKFLIENNQIEDDGFER